MPLFSKKIVPTEITSSIEKATSPTVTELDWALVFQICDAVNSTELGAKEARKLLQKKIMSNDPKTQVLALEILNSLGENCAGKFQPQLAAKSFGEDLYTLASSKTTDDRVHGKLAQCLGNWNSQYGSDPNFGAIRRAHDVLMNGIAPTHRRPASQSFRGSGRGTVIGDGGQMPRERRPVDVNKDIELAKNSAQLFSQTLSFTDPTQEDISKNELIQEFYGKCKQSQQLLASHLETCEDSDVISSLINANNELLSCFKSYDEMLEQHAVNQATVNSKTLYDRNSNNEQQQQQQQRQILGEIPGASSSSAAPAPLPVEQPKLFQHINNDPFDPFADTNQVQQTDNNINTAGGSSNSALPPPILPQRMHNE